METTQASLDHLTCENPMGETHQDAPRFDFDRKLKLEFHGTQVTRMRLNGLLVLISSVCFGMAASPQVTSSKIPRDNHQDAVIVTVNGTSIIESQVERLIKRHLKKRGRQDTNQQSNVAKARRKKLRHQALKELIETHLLDGEVRAAGIVISEQDVEKELQRRAAKEELSMSEWCAQMEAAGLEVGQIRQRARMDLARWEVIDLNISDREARQYYSKNIRHYDTEQRRISQILITPKRIATGFDHATARAQAEDLHRQIKQGANFSELAAKYSDCTMADAKGDLGVHPRGRLISPVDGAAFKLEVGQVSDVVKSHIGYHVVKVTDIKKGSFASFDQVKSNIKRKLYLESLTAKARIVYAPLPNNKGAATADPWAVFDREKPIDWSVAHTEKIGEMDWFVLPIEKFEVYFQKESETLARKYTPQLDNVFRFMEYYFPDHDIENRIRIVLSADLDTHRKMQSIFHAKNCYDAPRMDVSNKVPQIFIPARSWCVPLFLHEATHVFFYRSGYTGAHRNWHFVGEWLCGYFQTQFGNRPKYKFYEDTLGKMIMRRYLKEHPEFSLEELKKGPSGMSEPRAFEQLLACFYSFLEEKYGSPTFRRFLWLLLNEEDFDVAVKHTYERSLSELNEEWRDYYGLLPPV